jgi:hypothetical protein
VGGFKRSAQEARRAALMVPVAERLARPVVEAAFEPDEILGSVQGQVGPFGHVLAKQSIGVLVGGMAMST